MMPSLRFIARLQTGSGSTEAQPIPPSLWSSVTQGKGGLWGKREEEASPNAWVPLLFPPTLLWSYDISPYALAEVIQCVWLGNWRCVHSFDAATHLCIYSWWCSGYSWHALCAILKVTAMIRVGEEVRRRKHKFAENRLKCCKWLWIGPMASSFTFRNV